MIKLGNIRQTIQKHKLSTVLGGTLLLGLVTSGCSGTIEKVKEIKQNINKKTPDELAKEKYWSSFTKKELNLLNKVRETSNEYYKKNQVLHSCDLGAYITKIYVADKLKQEKSKGHVKNDTDLVRVISDGFKESIDVFDANMVNEPASSGYEYGTDIDNSFKLSKIQKELGNKLGYDTLDYTFSTGKPYKKHWFEIK